MKNDDAALLALTRRMLKVASHANSTSDFCRALVHQVLNEQKAVAVFVCRLDYDGNLKFLGRYGYDARAFHGGEIISIWEPRIITDAIRENRTLFAANRDEYHDRYPANVVLGVPGDGFAGIPLSQDGQAVGGVGIAFDCDLGDLELHDDFWTTIQLVAESHFVPVWATEANFAAGQASMPSPETLTARQLQVLSHIYDGETNSEIAHKMLLSESSIKQETVRIFKALGVANRKQAAARAQVLGLVDNRDEPVVPAVTR